MTRKTGKWLRYGVLFRQIVQTWRENQARIRRASGSRRTRTAHLARKPSTSSAFAQETRYPHEIDTGSKSLSTYARTRSADLRRCRCSSRTRLREQELPDASSNTLGVQAKVRKQHVARSGGAKGTHTSKAHGRW